MTLVSRNFVAREQNCAGNRVSLQLIKTVLAHNGIFKPETRIYLAYAIYVISRHSST